MTINLELRNRPDKKGYCSVRVVLQQKGKRVFVPLALKLLPSQWDAKTQKVVNHPQRDSLNNVLRLKLSDLHASSAMDNLTGDVSLEKIAGRKVSKTLFRDFAGACLDRWEKTKSLNSMKAYRSMLRQAMAFDKLVYIEDITPDWLARYEHHCWTECNDGGTLKRVAFISVVLKEAIRMGVIERDPFMIYKKPAKKNPPKVWLTMDEIKKIEKLARETGSEVIRKTAYWFLLSCYTGLRYSDVEKLNKEMIQDGRLILYTQKTGEVVSIKVTSKIKELIKIVLKQGTVYSNQKINQYLKSVAHHSKIKKLLTFHTGRHTFAVNCANLGISQEVAAKLLGHSDLKTTAIYYKIVNNRVDKEMEKWSTIK